MLVALTNSSACAFQSCGLWHQTAESLGNEIHSQSSGLCMQRRLRDGLDLPHSNFLCGGYALSSTAYILGMEKLENISDPQVIILEQTDP